VALTSPPPPPQKLTAAYNRVRQAKITAEICEIVAGAAATN
jgi:F0F1-type ATP synthase gamma subunit